MRLQKRDPSKHAFLAHAQGQLSAWELSGRWRQAIQSELPRHDDDFLGLAACELWKRYLPQRPSMEMLDDQMQQGYVNGRQSLFNWVQDFAIELLNSSIDDTHYAELGARLCQQVVDQFPDEDLFHLNFWADLGEFHFLAGNEDRGEQTLLELIKDHPDRALGYARLAMMLERRAIHQDRPEDLHRAADLI